MIYRIATAFLLVSLAACETSPLGRQQLRLLPEDQLAQMGADAFTQIKQKTPTSSNAGATRYVRCVATAITRQLGQGNWEVTVFEDPAANAFALPGGKIGVNTGMLKVAANQDQLATVIGHEVAHVVARHPNERVSTSYATDTGLKIVQGLAGARGVNSNLLGLLGVGAQVGILLPYGRAQETEADLLGLDIMATAGFDPRQSTKLWENMARAGRGQPPEFLSTHPSHATRTQELNGRIPDATQIYEQARSRGLKPTCKA